ncbi:MAG TPA: hypothetical protein VFK38_11575 [Candidatus Limnocylindrales bacterium]|nr:hypothetical protein [Candidatus Limnocylindrales bacterium]
MSGELTIFHVADVHGSDRCFRKWLNAARFYRADVIIIGGDLTAKVLVPLYPARGADASRRVATWQGRRVALETRAEAADFARRLRDEGAYALETTEDEVAELQASPDRERAVFTQLKVAQLADWLRLADERLAGQAVRALVMPGNDDPPDIDAVLADSRTLIDVQGRAVELAPGIWLAARGESTPTPWHTPRELPDDELGRRVEEALESVPPGVVAIWDLHMPPFATGVDEAPVLDGALRVQYDGSGEPRMQPVGSRSIRRLIEERQPALALHGHIHEGRGRYRLGRTTGFNPGSQYEAGVLLGVLARVSAQKGLRDFALTSG